MSHHGKHKYLVTKYHEPEGEYKASLTELYDPDNFELIADDLGVVIEAREMFADEVSMVRARQHIASVEIDGEATAFGWPDEDVSTSAVDITAAQARKLHNVDAAHQRGFRGKGQYVFVLDTGFIESMLPKLRDQVGYRGSYINGETYNDTNTKSHGTWCMGAIAEIAPDARYGIIKVLSSGTGSGSYSGIIAGINEAVKEGATHISLSLGGGKSTALNSAVNAARDKGVVVLAAAGNEQSGKTDNVADNTSPASAEGAITVAALDSDFIGVGFSNQGVCVDIGATGYRILLEGWLPGHWSGTSMATPYIAGIAALISSAGVAGPSVAKVLYAGAKKLNQPVIKVGVGAADTVASLNTVAPAPVPEPTPRPEPTPPVDPPTQPVFVGLGTLNRERSKYFGKHLEIYTQDTTTSPKIPRWTATPIPPKA